MRLGERSKNGATVSVTVLELGRTIHQQQSMPLYMKPNNSKEERPKSTCGGKRGSHPAKSGNLRIDANHPHHRVHREKDPRAPGSTELGIEAQRRRPPRRQRREENVCIYIFNDKQYHDRPGP